VARRRPISSEPSLITSHSLSAADRRRRTELQPPRRRSPLVASAPPLTSVWIGESGRGPSNGLLHSLRAFLLNPSTRRFATGPFLPMWQWSMHGQRRLGPAVHHLNTSGTDANAFYTSGTCIRCAPYFRDLPYINLYKKGIFACIRRTDYADGASSSAQ
jgi:hypothetical protein